MPVAAGRHVLTGSGDQAISGLGFSPDLILLFFSNNGVEDTWELSGGITGMGIVNRNGTQPGTVDNAPSSASAHEIWSSNYPYSSYLYDVAVWARSSPGGGGYALYGIQIGLDGFTLRYSGGYSGGSGNPIYWIAFGEEDELFTQRGLFYPGQNTMTTPFKPLTGFSVGSGGVTSGGHGSGGASFTSADSDICTWAFTSVWDAVNEDPDELVAIYMQRGVRALSSVCSFFNNIDTDLTHFESNQLYADAILIGGGLDFFGMFSHGATDTSYSAIHGFPGVGFIADDGRISVTAVGGLAGFGGQVTPSSTIGGEVEVQTPFDVEAVLFMCPSYRDYTGLTSDATGATGFGFMCPAFEAVIASGARLGVSTARFQSPNYSWVSNFTEVDSVGVSPSYGNTEITSNGFKVITATNGQPMEAMMFMALGFPVVDAPGFFRVVHR